MCSYCGCSEVPAIADLMEEHVALVDQAQHIREVLGSGEPEAATSLLSSLVARLGGHVRREEDGIFTALRSTGEYVDEVDALEGEHRGLEATIAGLDTRSCDFAATVTRMLDDLDVHVQREELGIFPVAVVTLGAAGWNVIDQAHLVTPSFLRLDTAHAVDPADRSENDTARVELHQPRTRTPCSRSH